MVSNTDLGRRDDFYSSNAFRGIEKTLQEISGIEFRLEDFRPTFTQMNPDRNPNLLPDVSKFLGHATTGATEEHYGRIRYESAFQRLEETWKPAPAPIGQDAHKQSPKSI